MATLHEALDKGINFFDTADIYGQGDSERLLRSVFRSQRHRLLLCSKAGYTFGTLQRVALWVKPLARRVLRRWKSGQTAAKKIRSGSLPQNFAPAHITAAVEGSLRRLGTDYLDVFFLHRPPAEVIADGTALETLVRLKDRGLVRYYGVCCATTTEALACLRYPEISVLQVPLSLSEPQAINEVLPLAVELKAALVAYRPFAQGALWSDQRLFDSLKKNPSRTPAQTALRFVMQLSGVGVVLPGMTSRVHLKENIGALEAPPLTSEEAKLLCAIARSKQVPVSQ